MNSFRNLPDPSKGLEPMQEMLTQKLVYLVVVTKLSTTLLKMLDPVETCILNLKRKVLFYPTAFDIVHERTWLAHTTYVLLKKLGHKLYAFCSKGLMCLLLVHPEVWVFAPVLAEEVVSK
jgi:hypothetical protein